MRVGCYQFEPIPFGVEENCTTISKMISEAGLDLLVFPELALSGYVFETAEELYAVSLRAESHQFKPVQEAVDRSGCAAVIGFAEAGEQDHTVYNSSICLKPGEVPTVYRKAHLFGTETLFFSPGDSGFFTFDYLDTRIGMLVCFDHYFPEAARSLMLSGAQVICHPSNLVLEGAAQLTTRVRAMENRVFWLLGNRCGAQGELTFTGGSQIVAPNGAILADAGRDTTELITAVIDPGLSDDKHISRYNEILHDRRTDLYST